MKTKHLIFLVTLCMASFAASASAQMGMGAGTGAPQMRGVWNPTVGSGSAYQMESKGQPKTEMEIAVVGKETVDGKPGYWLEIGMKSPQEGGTMYMKQLFVLDGKQTAIKRMIMQMAGQPPMEMPMGMMAHGKAAEQSTDVRNDAVRVGSETITTPGGTFTCEHYRMKDGSGDVWINEKVAPWGIVKATGRDGNMTLLRVITNAKSHITGTPQKFDPMEMMRRQKD